MAEKKSLGRGLGDLIAKGAPKQNSKDTKEVAGKKSHPSVRVEPKKGGASGSKLVVSSSEVVKEKMEKGDTSPFQEIEIGLIDTNPYQPRRSFDDKDINELADSIESEGLLQPIVVRQKGDRYELIAGERRLRACRVLDLKVVPARLVKASDASSAVISLIENLQRENLNPIDEAMGYASLMKDFDLTQEEVSERVGKARASVANALRLVQLEQEIQGYLSKGMISTGHAKVLLGLEVSSQRLMLARRIIEEGLSVRDTERFVQQAKKKSEIHALQRPITSVQTAVIKDLEKQLGVHLNSKVMLQHGVKKGKLIINYQGNDDLHRILERIGFMKGQRSSVA